ncbi:MAG: hypothetical protein ACTSQJ_01940 [Promethearchaeota archaeon]
MRKMRGFFFLTIFAFSSILLFLNLFYEVGSDVKIINDSLGKENKEEKPTPSAHQIVFYDSFESGADSKWQGFGGRNYWHVTNTDGYSGTKSLWCANETTGFFEKKSGGASIRVRDSLTLTDIDLKNFDKANMSFWIKLDGEVGFFDLLNITVKIKNSQLYFNQKYSDIIIELNHTMKNYLSWHYYYIDLSFFCGYEHIDFIFTFDSIDNFNNLYSGVKIDEVKIGGNTDNSEIGTEFCPNEDDSFYYYIATVDYFQYLKFFGKPPIGTLEERIKVKIFDISSNSFYWDVIIRLWDPTDDFDSIGDGDEYNLIVYKNPINMMGGADFFIPCNDVWTYIQWFDHVDDTDFDGKFYINSNSWKDEWDNKMRFEIEIVFDKFYVRKIYKEDGVLESLLIEMFSGPRIFEMFLEHNEDYGSGDENKGPEDIYVTIPGYNLIILISSIFVISIILEFKCKKYK